MLGSKHDEITGEVMEAFIRLRRMHRQKKSPVEGMKHSEVMTLFRIKELSGENGVKVSDLSNSLKVKPPTVSQMIDSLEAEGLVTRTMDSSDKRLVLISLTKQGEDVFKKAINSFFVKFSGLVDTLGEEKSMVLAELLNVSIKYLKEDEN